MSIEKTTEILRCDDGSIDYDYYVTRASNFRNREVLRLAGNIFARPVTRAGGFSVLVTVFLVALIL